MEEIMIRITRTKQGMVRGLPAADPYITSFKGIQFAKPPVGDLRWRAPQEAMEYIGIKDCFEFAPISLQNTPGENKEDFYSREWNLYPEIPMSEDCLYLNIWTPAKTIEERLPVYVWYFGGALQFGNTAEMEFDGERIARRGIVVVSVNYRINVFGFFAHPELTREHPEAPANFGNLDQKAGLQWVYENIMAFGGDPQQITIGGQSAGGGSVLTQLNDASNKLYIKRAVVESGMFLSPFHDSPYPTLEQLEKQGETFFEKLGIKSLREARELPASYLRDKNREFEFQWWTAIDWVFQKEYYLKNLLSGKVLDVPLLFGYTKDEFLEERNGIKINTIQLAVVATVLSMRKTGRHKNSYCYEFALDMPGEDRPGAFHSSDLWFFFETLAKCFRPFTGVHYDLARTMCDSLANFIRTGNPNDRKGINSLLPEWEDCLCLDGNLMVFDTTIMRKRLESEQELFAMAETFLEQELLSEIK